MARPPVAAEAADATPAPLGPARARRDAPPRARSAAQRCSSAVVLALPLVFLLIEAHGAGVSTVWT